jgi:hypothetical protein
LTAEFKHNRNEKDYQKLVDRNQAALRAKRRGAHYEKGIAMLEVEKAISEGRPHPFKKEPVSTGTKKAATAPVQSTEKSMDICASCGLHGHKRSSNKLCSNYKGRDRKGSNLSRLQAAQAKCDTLDSNFLCDDVQESIIQASSTIPEYDRLVAE